MKFSEVYSIDRTAADVWFDPILTHDTKLFLDPLLIAKQAISPFEGSHQKLVGFFDHAFVEAAKTDQDETKPRFRRLLAALEFPEVKELCLGYADKTTFGLGSAAGVAKVFAAGIYESIKAGITHIEHFEEVALFNEGIGADRISDVTGNILRRELAEYTLAICRTHNIPVEKFTIGHGEYDLGTSRWVPLEVQLPVNPFPKKRQPVLLVPEVYLNKLPEINYLDFADYMWRTRNELVRDELGIEIKEQLDKKKIVKLARAHREEADRYTAIKAEGPPRPYDLRQDPNRLYRWYGGAQQFVLANPMALPPATTRDQCLGVVDLIIQRYKQFVEQKGGYILLWNQNGKRKAEADAQRLFYAIAISYCRKQH